MFTKIFITTIILLIFMRLTSDVAAQTKDMNFMIKGEPLYLINNGLYVDFEKKVSNTKWLVVSPQFYVKYKDGSRDKWRDVYEISYDNENPGESHHYLKYIGAGLDLTIKNFIFSNKYVKNIYFGYGASWQYYNLTLEKLIWQTYAEGDLNILLPETKQYQEQINKFGLNGIVGLQLKVWKGMYVDFYTGWGFRYSVYHSSDGSVVKFNSGSWDFGYTGINFIGGIRVGVGF